MLFNRPACRGFEVFPIGRIVIDNLHGGIPVQGASYIAYVSIVHLPPNHAAKEIIPGARGRGQLGAGGNKTACGGRDGYQELPFLARRRLLRFQALCFFRAVTLKFCHRIESAAIRRLPYFRLHFPFSSFSSARTSSELALSFPACANSRLQTALSPAINAILARNQHL